MTSCILPILISLFSPIIRSPFPFLRITQTCGLAHPVSGGFDGNQLPFGPDWRFPIPLFGHQIPVPLRLPWSGSLTAILCTQKKTHRLWRVFCQQFHKGIKICRLIPFLPAQYPNHASYQGTVLPVFSWKKQSLSYSVSFFLFPPRIISL